MCCLNGPGWWKEDHLWIIGMSALPASTLIQVFQSFAHYMGLEVQCIKSGSSRSSRTGTF